MVLFKGAAGEQCAPVPIWNISEWSHPGNSETVDVSVTSGHGLCGSVRFNWLTKSGSHSAYNPESGTSLSGGASKVGEYVDPSCSSA